MCEKLYPYMHMTGNTMTAPSLVKEIPKLTLAAIRGAGGLVVKIKSSDPVTMGCLKLKPWP